MDHLPLFDCNASFGPRLNKHPLARWTKQHLLDDLDLAGISSALVTYSQSLIDDAMLNNRVLIEQIGDDRDRLHPCWVCLPNMCGDFPEPVAFVKEMRNVGVRAVRVEPGLFGIPLRQQIWASVRDALRDEGALVVTSMNLFDQDFATVEQLTEIFQPLPVLLMHHGWHQWRQVSYLMERFPSLHIEFSSFQGNRAMEHFAQRFGAERLLFGTGLPEKAPGAARGFLDWSLLPRDDVRQIASGNLERLLHVSRPLPAPRATRWSDELTAAARNGQPLPCDVLDAHAHLLADGVHTGGRYYVMPHGDAQGIMELNRKVGIDRIAVMSWAGPLSLDTARGNEIVADAVRRWPEHFIGLATVNPGHDTTEQIEQIIQKYLVDLRFAGLKTYSGSTGLLYNDPLLERFFRFGDEHRLYAVIDECRRMNDQEMDELATRYPNLSLHLDHCGRSWQFAQWAARVIQRHPNMLAQINFTAVTNGVIEYLVEQVGEDRVLFGTDQPMRDPRPQASWLTFTRLSQQTKEKIFGANFLRDISRRQH